MGTFSLSKSGHVALGGSSFMAEELVIKLSSIKTRTAPKLHSAGGMVLHPPKGTSLGTHVAPRGPKNGYAFPVSSFPRERSSDV